MLFYRLARGGKQAELNQNSFHAGSTFYQISQSVETTSRKDKAKATTGEVPEVSHKQPPVAQPFRVPKIRTWSKQPTIVQMSFYIQPLTKHSENGIHHGHPSTINQSIIDRMDGAAHFPEQGLDIEASAFRPGNILLLQYQGEPPALKPA